MSDGPCLFFADDAHEREIAWDTPPRSLASCFTGTHLWRIDLSLHAADTGNAFDTLSDDERDRARRFKSVTSRQRFIAARSMLRFILSRYVKMHPSDVEFQYGHWGKPALAGTPSIQFNLSHSHDLALIAVQYGNPIGVDVEHRNASQDYEEIARLRFAPDDAQRVAAAPAAQQVELFLHLWTRYEAMLKAAGTGLAEQNTIAFLAASQRSYRVRSFTPVPDFIAAYASPRQGGRSRLQSMGRCQFEKIVS